MKSNGSLIECHILFSNKSTLTHSLSHFVLDPLIFLWSIYEIPVTRTHSLYTPDSKHFYLLLRIQHFYHTVRDGESIDKVNPLPHNTSF